MEIDFIRTFETNNPKYGYNLTDGGEGTLGWNPSDETRKNWSNARKGKPLGPFTDEHRANLSKDKTGKKRIPFTDEHI